MKSLINNHTTTSYEKNGRNKILDNKYLYDDNIF
ncbi:hypothetical protein CJ739_3067 [Mariniflexile rhizosphaerae]|nr:hypothetical protein CJ739_3067 [Mariniflexile sp. TRM1-10]